MYEQAIPSTSRAIIVDHDAATTDLIAELLASVGFVPLCCSTWAISVACIEQAQAQLLVLDLDMGDPNSMLALLGELRQNMPTRALQVIVVSTDDRLLEQIAEPLRELSCVALAKPFELDDFFSSVSLCRDTGAATCNGSRAE